MTNPGPWPPQPNRPMPPAQWVPGPQPQWGGPPQPNWAGAPSSWGGPPIPPNLPPYGWQPHEPRRAPRTWLLPVLLAIAVGIGGLGYWGYSRYQSKQQLAGIRNTVEAFAEASDTADTTKLASMMCEEERAQFVDGFEGQPNDGPIAPATRQPVNIGAINVKDNTATVEVTRPPSAMVTLKLKRENRTWKLCNPS